MLQSLELENFKAFGERAHIQFAPITLIFGENSAGKSTILQALYLLKQTLESRETGALLLPRTENGIVDLGSFQEMLFEHDLERMLSIRIETKIPINSTPQFLHKGNAIAIEFHFKRPSLEAEVLLDEIIIYDCESSKCIAKFQPSDRTIEPEEFLRRRVGFFRNPRGLPPSKLVEAKCVWVTKESEYWEPEFEWCKENTEKILNYLHDEKSDLEERLKRQTDEREPSNKRPREVTRNLQNEIDSISADIKLFSDGFDLEDYISSRHGREMGTILGIQGFLPVGIISRKRTPWLTEFQMLLRRRPEKTIFDITQLAILTSSALDRTLEALFPISPFRRPPERLYIFRGTSPQDVGYRGDLLPDLLFRDHELVNETNKWLKKLEIGYKLEMKSVGDRSRDLFEVRLIDTHGRKGVDVALPDVGFGVSQLLPFIVQSLVSEGRIISIEQPEVHVHPKLQADLGDLLAEAIKESRRNRFIIETHSEHLILRLQRLVRKRVLNPEDVSVIYVSRHPEGAKAEQLRLDEDGDFIDEWPKGFFLERLRELR